MWTTLAVIATLYLLRRCQRQLHRNRLVADMPTSKIRSASQGYTELIGIARQAEQPRISPLGSELCLWWRYTIERYQSSGRSSHWVTVEKKSSRAAFYIEDTTGRCRVEPDSGEISSHHRRVWHGHSRRPIGAVPKTEAKTNMLSARIGMGRYRYSEYLIKDGDPLYVLGHFESDSSGLQTLQPEQLAGDILRSWKTDFPALLKRFDINGDGELGTEEWKLVQHAARLESKKQLQEVSRQPPQHSITQPEHKGLPFIISSHEQDRLGQKFRNSARLSAVGFLLSGSLSTWLLTSRFLA